MRPTLRPPDRPSGRDSGGSTRFAVGLVVEALARSRAAGDANR